MLFSSLKVISGFPVICVICSDGCCQHIWLPLMSRQGPGDAVSNPQRLLHLHGQMKGVKIQRMTLNSYWSFMLQNLFHFYDLSLKAVRRGEQRLIPDSMSGWVPPCPMPTQCHSGCLLGFPSRGLRARFESGVNTNVFWVSEVLFKNIWGAHSEL